MPMMSSKNVSEKKNKHETLVQPFQKLECAKVIQCKGIGAAIPKVGMCKGDPM